MTIHSPWFGQKSPNYLQPVEWRSWIVRPAPNSLDKWYNTNQIANEIYGHNKRLKVTHFHSVLRPYSHLSMSAGASQTTFHNVGQTVKRYYIQSIKAVMNYKRTYGIYKCFSSIDIKQVSYRYAFKNKDGDSHLCYELKHLFNAASCNHPPLMILGSIVVRPYRLKLRAHIKCLKLACSIIHICLLYA